MSEVIAAQRWAGRLPLARLRASGPATLVAAFAVLLAFVDPDAITPFATVFLGVFFEALPFLLLGVLVSATIQTFVPPSLVQRLVPPGRLRAALAGAALGAVFPVCECGVVPAARRLLDKGASLPAALGFLLAGPVVNPVVFATTWVALGREMAVLRLATSLLMAIAVAWIYGFHPRPETVLVPPSAPALPTLPTDADRASDPDRATTITSKLLSATEAAGEELLEMGRYLVVGAAAAALLRTVVAGPALVAAGQGAVVSVPLMMALAALLSICSAVDAFVALSLSGFVSSGAMLAFLVFGPVVDIKSVLLYGAIFRWRSIAVIVMLLAQIALLIGVAINLNVG
jgi:uncharacterized membrane protein YraQ (UPF0718 family)